MDLKRYLQNPISDELLEKMIFIGGPRQVGKTTLANNIGKKLFNPFLYLNWDRSLDRERIRKEEFPSNAKLLILDEIHKYRPWKRLVKGIYDTSTSMNILVTGSARLDIYRKGGDSLLGRYHYYRLHPFSVAEVIHRKENSTVGEALSIPSSSRELREAYEQLMVCGGFPEPFIKNSTRTLRRWSSERIERLVREDIRDLEPIRDLSLMEILVSILPSKVGSLLSLNSLREDVEVAHKTISHWMNILEQMYYHFRIYPFNAKTIQSLRKEPKMYLWDWSQLENNAAKLENLVASHLHKFIHYHHDHDGYKLELHFLRDKEGREVDFLITNNKKPWFCVEVKQTDLSLSQNITYFKERLKIPYCYQVVGVPDVDYIKQGVRVMSVEKLLGGLI